MRLDYRWKKLQATLIISVRVLWKLSREDGSLKMERFGGTSFYMKHCNSAAYNRYSNRLPFSRSFETILTQPCAGIASSESKSAKSATLLLQFSKDAKLATVRNSRKGVLREIQD